MSNKVTVTHDMKPRLLCLLSEMTDQRQSVAGSYPEDGLSFDDEMMQIKEFITEEPMLAYEVIVCALERHKFKVSGHAAVALLELGLLARFKTLRPTDNNFDLRPITKPPFNA